MKKIFILVWPLSMSCFACEEQANSSSNFSSKPHFSSHEINPSTVRSRSYSNSTEAFMRQEEVNLHEELPRIFALQKKIDKNENLTDEDLALLKRMGKLIFYRASLISPKRSTIP